MFEYLMPLLVMPTYEHTLLDQSYRTAVERQIAYGNQRGVPWGSSESGYYTLDAALNYQYRAFGVPGLGLARGCHWPKPRAASSLLRTTKDGAGLKPRRARRVPLWTTWLTWRPGLHYPVRPRR